MEDRESNLQQSQNEEKSKLVNFEEGDSANVMPNSQDLSDIQLVKALEEKNEYLVLSQRIQADFENYKRRNRTSMSEAYQSGVFDTVERFIPVLDNIERAIDSCRVTASSDILLKGVDMVAKQFKEVLAQLEVEEISAFNQEFNPEYHNAVLQIEAENEDLKGLVVEVLQKGYKIKDKVVRHSMVKVSC